jgi:hypothetical protein
MSEQNKRITRRVLEQLFEKGNLDAADELIHRAGASAGADRRRKMRSHHTPVPAEER